MALVVVSAQFLAAVLCLPPAAVAVGWLLNRYEDYFEEKRLFFAMAVGLFAGILAAVLEAFLAFSRGDFVAQTGVWYSGSFAIFGYALLESVIKMAALGSKRFRMRKDTPFYGAALGLTFGAMMSLWWVASQLVSGGSADVEFALENAPTWIVLAVAGSGIALAGGAAGVMLGRGSASGRMLHGILQGTLVQAPILLLLFLWAPGEESPLLLPRILIAALACGYGVGALVMVRNKVLEVIVPPEIRDLVRRERRREARSERP